MSEDDGLDVMQDLKQLAESNDEEFIETTLKAASASLNPLMLNEFDNLHNVWKNYYSNILITSPLVEILNYLTNDENPDFTSRDDKKKIGQNRTSFFNKINIEKITLLLPETGNDFFTNELLSLLKNIPSNEKEQDLAYSLGCFEIVNNLLVGYFEQENVQENLLLIDSCTLVLASLTWKHPKMQQEFLEKFNGYDTIQTLMISFPNPKIVGDALKLLFSIIHANSETQRLFLEHSFNFSGRRMGGINFLLEMQRIFQKNSDIFKSILKIFLFILELQEDQKENIITPQFIEGLSLLPTKFLSKSSHFSRIVVRLLNYVPPEIISDNEEIAAISAAAKAASGEKEGEKKEGDKKRKKTKAELTIPTSTMENPSDQTIDGTFSPKRHDKKGKNNKDYTQQSQDAEGESAFSETVDMENLKTKIFALETEYKEKYIKLEEINNSAVKEIEEYRSRIQELEETIEANKKEYEITRKELEEQYSFKIEEIQIENKSKILENELKIKSLQEELDSEAELTIQMQTKLQEVEKNYRAALEEVEKMKDELESQTLQAFREKKPLEEPDEESEPLKELEENEGASMENKIQEKTVDLSQQQQKMAYEEKVIQLQDIIAEKTEKEAEFGTMIKKMRLEIKELQDLLAQVQNRNKLLEQQLDNKKEPKLDPSELEKQKIDLESEHETRINELKEKFERSEHETQKKSESEYQEKINQMKQEFERTENQMKQEMEEKQFEIDSLKEIVDQKATEFVNLKQEFDDNSSELLKSNEILQKNETEIELQKQESNKQKQELEKMKEEFEKNQNFIQEINQKLSEMSEVVSKTNSKLIEKDQEIETLNQELDEMEKELDKKTQVQDSNTSQTKDEIISLLKLSKINPQQEDEIVMKFLDNYSKTQRKQFMITLSFLAFFSCLLIYFFLFKSKN